MNKQDKHDLQLIDYRLDEQDKRVIELHTEFNTKLGDIHEDIKFIKENLFNPNEGLWAETKQNSLFRESAAKWRTTIGAGFVGLFFKQLRLLILFSDGFSGQLGSPNRPQIDQISMNLSKN